MRRSTLLAVAVLALTLPGCLQMMDKSRREAYVKEHWDALPDRNKDAILEGKVFIGMPRDQLIASWGYPIDINRSVGSWGVHEQFVYSQGSYSRTYVYVRDGKVTSWQQ